jgi:hypothetical protein
MPFWRDVSATDSATDSGADFLSGPCNIRLRLSRHSVVRWDVLPAPAKGIVTDNHVRRYFFAGTCDEVTVADGDDVVVVLVVVVTVVDTTVTEVGGLSIEAGATMTFVAVELRALHPVASHAVAAK